MPGQADLSILAAYDQVCRAHDKIADFRGKLLALLPIASAGGLLLLISDNGISDGVKAYLGPIGIFAVFATLGLLAHELRGIQRCFYLQRCARKLESKMLNSMSEFGAFTFTNKARNWTGAPLAAALIYPAVIGAWIYMSLEGFGVSCVVKGGLSVCIGVASTAGVGFLVYKFDSQAEADYLTANEETETLQKATSASEQDR
jgi:hypothetical protein